MILYSSGTTKGYRRPVERDEAELDANFRDVYRAIGWIPFFKSIDICLPLDHIFGYMVNRLCTAKGMQVNVHEDLINPPIFTSNIVASTPRLLKSYHRRGLLEDVDVLITGSEKYDLDIPGKLVLEGYGKSEVGIISLSTPFFRRKGSVGKPIMPLKITDEGEIVVADYTGKAHYTGDRGYMRGGYLYIEGRMDPEGK